MTGKKWRDKDVNYLLKNYGKMSLKKLSAKLNRTEKACRIKFWKTRDFNDYICATECARILHVDIKTVTEHLLKHDFPYIRIHREIRIHFDDFVDWLESHQDLWDSKKLDHLALGYEYDWLKKKRAEDKNKPYRKARWRQYDITTLCLMMQQGSDFKEISKKLSRSESSVRHKWNRLNHRKD